MRLLAVARGPQLIGYSSNGGDNYGHNTRTLDG
jgi:hypothetical protein